jgi:HPt (histidine-containing phosphotransfer) domain-containing protein
MTSIPAEGDTGREITIDVAALDELRDLGDSVGQDLLSDLIELFVQDTERLLTQLRDAAGTGDIAAVGQIAHNIKGSSGQLGARQLVASCGRLESASAGSSLSAPDLHEVEEDYVSVRAALTQHSSRSGPRVGGAS